MRIALLPLDERPVNTRLPEQVAAIAGAELLLPPVELLPAMRIPGNADQLAEWLSGAAGDADTLVVSLDMLAYGGLIGSRTTHDATPDVLRRLGTLRDIRQRHPSLPISAVSTVMRASRSHSPAEEPLYWADHGVELHELGAALHREFLGESHDRQKLQTAVPADVRGDFLLRRLRNHAADLYAIELAARRSVDTLLITADDTAPRAAGSLEQIWLRHWVSATNVGAQVLMYPGADEVGAVLVARALAAGMDQDIRIAVEIPEEGGADRVAPFENVAIAAGVARQIAAAGAVTCDEWSDADVVLVVHAPDASGNDWSRTHPGDSRTAQVAANVAHRVEELLAAGHSVAVADVRYANGSDPELVRQLATAGLVERLLAYGGWNTAGNTVGSVVAAVVAHVVGRRRGQADEAAVSLLRWHRVVEDFAYQALVRTELGQADSQFREHISVPFDDPAVIQEYVNVCAERLAVVAAGLGADAGRWEIGNLRLPWHRTFEIDFDLTPRT